MSVRVQNVYHVFYFVHFSSLAKEAMRLKSINSQFAGTFFVSMAILLLELVLTRIWSVTMGYHFAFMAISLAVFGSTIGSLAVYAFPNRFAASQLQSLLPLNALYFGLSTVVSFLVQLNIPFAPHLNLIGIGSTLLSFLVVSIPFYFGGVCITLALTKLPEYTSGMYAADLAGATAGCLCYVGAANFTDGPTVVFLVSTVASLASVFYSLTTGASRSLKLVAVVSCLLGCLYVIFNTVLVNAQCPFLRIGLTGNLQVKIPDGNSSGNLVSAVDRLTHSSSRTQLSPQIGIYEKWSANSRIAVIGIPDALSRPALWGGKKSNTLARQLMLYTDTWVATALPYFAGNFREIEYLKSDVTNLAFFLKSGARVLVVGSGGGRDILSALLFNEKSVVGVEINKTILDTVNQVFGDFTGHLDRNLQVQIVNDDARSFLSRDHSLFDIIQISVINTSSGAGTAHALTENSIYTVEAWRNYIQHLTQEGLISCTRFYKPDSPGEIYRLSSLARKALIDEGISDPRAHILIVAGPPLSQSSFDKEVATMILSKPLLTDDVVSRVEKVAQSSGFRVLLSPKFCSNPVLAKLISGQDPTLVAAAVPTRIDPPTDDCPFFFYMFSLQNLTSWDPLRGPALFGYNYAQIVLLVVACTVLVLSLLCIFGPFILTRTASKAEEMVPHLIFFSAIGLGFISIELSQMQRLTVFLGYPNLGLSVVLFTLLLGGSIGSLITQRWNCASGPRMAIAAQLASIVILICTGVATPLMIEQFRPYDTTIRIIAAAALLLPSAVFMGMPCPMGLRLAALKLPNGTPWFWATNGATTVFGSVFALILAVYSGISTAFWFGVTAYVCALLATMWTARNWNITVQPSSHGD